MIANISRIVSRRASAMPVPAEKANKVITCKNKELNLKMLHYKPSKTLVKFGSIPLASNGWAHRKAKGDFFIIHPIESQTPGVVPQETTFTELGLNEEWTQILESRFAITNPTPFQQQAMPQMMNNEHVVLAAETGCGKTLAYLLPILQNLKSVREREGGRRFNSPLALILTPGRELATQIGEVVTKLGQDMNINVKTLLGGHTKRLLMNPTFDDVDILVGSMGVISKLVTMGIYRTDCIRHIVLDEADTLLDDSFSEKLTYFLRRFPFHKNLLQNLNSVGDIVGTQLILVSATMPKLYDDLLAEIIDTKTIKNIASPELHHLLRKVPQRFFRMNKSDRPSHLMGIVKSEFQKNRPVIVFSNKTPTADFVSIMLNEAGVDCLNLTGDMQVAIREGRFEKFQSGECNVLSTTDVGSRGLDTSRVAHVINFDFPLHIADYIHRCGRVGRVGSRLDAQVTNFISSGREFDLVQRIEHAARTGNELHDVNANITNIIKRRIMKNIGEPMDE